MKQFTPAATSDESARGSSSARSTVPDTVRIAVAPAGPSIGGTLPRPPGTGQPPVDNAGEAGGHRSGRTWTVGTDLSLQNFTISS
jgi:hypothetical protein